MVRKKNSSLETRDSYFKTSLDKNSLGDLKAEKIDIEHFRRHVKKCEFNLKDNQVLDLSQIKADYLMLQKEIAQKLILAEKTRPSTLHLKAIPAITNTTETRTKALKNNTNQEGITNPIQPDLLNVSLGMTLFNHVQIETDNMIKKLKALVAGRQLAVNEIEALAFSFEKQQTLLENNQITPIVYIDNCKKIFERSKKILNKPLTLAERVYYVAMSTIRNVLNFIDQIYSWLLSTALTKTQGYKTFSSAQQATLIQEVSTITQAFLNLQNELKKSEAQEAIIANKREQRNVRIAEAARGEGPHQEKIKAAKDKIQQKAQARPTNKKPKKSAYEHCVNSMFKSSEPKYKSTAQQTDPIETTDKATSTYSI